MTAIALVVLGLLVVGCAGFMVLGTGSGLFVLADQEASQGSQPAPTKTKKKTRKGRKVRKRR